MGVPPRLIRRIGQGLKFNCYSETECRVGIRKFMQRICSYTKFIH